VADCIFCKIAAKEIGAQVVYEDGDFLAFRDINPVAPTHVLLIPKRHIGSLLDLNADDAALAGRMLALAAQLARRLDLAQGGFRVVINTGKQGGQTVEHFHLHLLGGRALEWPPG